MSRFMSLIMNIWWSPSTQPAQVPEAPVEEQAGAGEQQQNSGEENAAENVEEKAAPPSDGEDESDMWEETFQSHTDSKPYGKK